MTWVAVGVGGAGIATSLYGMSEQQRAAKEAAALSGQASAQARSELAPYRAASLNAMREQSDMMNNPNSFTQSPYGQWMQQQGQQGVERSAAARGGINSGSVLAELAKYSQNAAGAGFNERYNQIGAPIAGGQAAATNMGQLGMNNAATQGNALMSGASNMAGGLNSMVNTGAQAYGMYKGNQQSDRMQGNWDKYFAQGGQPNNLMNNSSFYKNPWTTTP